VLLHTFVGEDAARARATARAPFIRYLRSSLSLFQSMANSLGLKADVGSLTEADRDYLLNVAYERYVESSALIGSPASCQRIVEQLRQIGVDEIGCFVDFGVEPDTVMDNLPHLDELRQACQDARRSLAAPLALARPTSA
jgi:iturin family lipopeptide synthetase A